MRYLYPLKYAAVQEIYDQQYCKCSKQINTHKHVESTCKKFYFSTVFSQNILRLVPKYYLTCQKNMFLVSCHFAICRSILLEVCCVEVCFRLIHVHVYCIVLFTMLLLWCFVGKKLIIRSTALKLCEVIDDVVTWYFMWRLMRHATRSYGNRRCPQMFAKNAVGSVF